MKKIIYVILVFVIAFTVLTTMKNIIIKTSIEKIINVVTGLKLEIGGFNAGIFKNFVDVKNLKLFNPQEFKNSMMLDMPQIYVKYDLPSAIKGKIHLPKVIIDLKEFIVIKNEAGKLNLDSLKVVQAQKEEKNVKEKQKGKLPPIQIDSLRLKIGKVTYKDYSSGQAPSVKEFNINLDEEYSNITDPYALASLIVVRALTNTTIAGLTNFDLSGLESTVSDTLLSAEKALGQTTKAAEEAVKGAADTLKNTTEELKDIIKFPFGSKQKQ